MHPVANRSQALGVAAQQDLRRGQADRFGIRQLE
jgi:hypothetical protein